MWWAPGPGGDPGEHEGWRWGRRVRRGHPGGGRAAVHPYQMHKGTGGDPGGDLGELEGWRWGRRVRRGHPSGGGRAARERHA
jgi:hypothetical protein